MTRYKNLLATIERMRARPQGRRAPRAPLTHRFAHATLKGLGPPSGSMRQLPPHIRAIGAAIAVAAGVVVVSGASAGRPNAHLLSIAAAGEGLVRSADGRIRCRPRCRASYKRGAVVKLTSSPGAHFSFERWSGECVGAAPECIVVVDRPASVRALFTRNLGYVRLTVGGPGTIVSEPQGLACGATADKCTGSFGEGTTIRLIATPDSALETWGGACSGRVSDTCTFVVGPANEASATFRPAAPAPGADSLTVTLFSRGDVASDPPGIACPPTCNASFPEGTVVTLRTPVPYEWRGACVGNGATCTLVLDGALSVLAVRPPNPEPPRVGLNVSVSGRGVVTGDDIHCGGATGTLLDCEALFVKGSTVVLRAVRPRDGRFHGWGGFCQGKDPVCTVLVSAPKTVIAVFRR
jgi:hypothetical protein